MTVKELLILTGGRTKVRIVGTTKNDSYVDCWSGIVDDINFNKDKIPYADCEIGHISVLNGTDELLIILDSQHIIPKN